MVACIFYILKLYLHLLHVTAVFFMILSGDHTGFSRYSNELFIKANNYVHITMSPTVAAVLACKGAEAEVENTIQQPAQKRNVGHVRGKKALSTCPHCRRRLFLCRDSILL